MICVALNTHRHTGRCMLNRGVSQYRATEVSNNSFIVTSSIINTISALLSVTEMKSAAVSSHLSVVHTYSTNI